MELARSATKGRHGPRASMWNKVVLWCQRSCQDVLGAGSAFSLGTSRGRWPVVAPSGTPPYRKTIAYSCSGWATGCRARAQSPARLFFFFFACLALPDSGHFRQAKGPSFRQLCGRFAFASS